MLANKSLTLFVLFIGTTLFAAEPTPTPRRDAPPVPEISSADRRFLTQTIRRTMRQWLTDKTIYRLTYHPPTIQNVEGRVVVRLRQAGYVVGIGISDVKSVADACQEGSIRALGSARAIGRQKPEWLDDIRIDLEILGDSVPYDSKTPWTQSGAIATFLDPGLEGLRLYLDNEYRWFTPAEMIAKNIPLDEAVRILAEESTLSPAIINEAKISKFRSLHWWEVDDAGRTVSLVRGLLYVPPSEVTPERLRQAAADLITYQRGRQRPDGLYTCEFDPAGDAYGLNDIPTSYALAAWSLTEAAGANRDSHAAKSADAALAALKRDIFPMPKHEGIAYLTTEENDNPLGLTAAYCLALTSRPESQDNVAERAEIRRKLVKAMLWLQNDEGKFLTAFPPALELPPETMDPGLAMLALARAYREEPTQEIVEAFDKALKYYRPMLRRNGSPHLAAWLMEAYAVMAQPTRKKEYADFVFEMADWVIKHQVGSEEKAPYLEGGFRFAPGEVPNATAALLANGLSAAAQLAQRRKDQPRVESCTNACVAASRFMLQLQFREDECFYVRSVPETVNGIRTSPVDCRLRLDVCAYTLRAFNNTLKLIGSHVPGNAK